MRAGLRKPSQRAISSCTVAGLSSSMRCTLRCSRQHSTARSRCSAGTLSRALKAATGSMPRCSCITCRGSSPAGVSALPRSWASAANPTRSSPGASFAAMSQTSSICTPVSTSGWNSARCGTPYSASTSGSTARRASASRKVRRKADGVRLRSALPSSCQTRSGTSSASSPSAAISRMSASVSGAMVKPSAAKRAMKRAARSTRSGSSTKASPTWRSVRDWMSRTPPNGSTRLPSASRAIALMVKSRRRRSSSRVTDGSACTVKPACPRADLRSVRASAYSSPPCGCRNTGKSRPTCR